MSNLNNVMKEFKAFILKGNIIDMAVGVIIGGAFSKIVTSLVNDILMPVLGALTGGARFPKPHSRLRPPPFHITRPPPGAPLRTRWGAGCL